MNKIIDKLREKSIDFEQWLQEEYVKQENPLDDDIPDGFSRWLENLDIADVLDYGTRFASLVADSIISDLTKLSQGEPYGWMAKYSWLKIAPIYWEVKFDVYDFEEDAWHDYENAVQDETHKLEIFPIYTDPPSPQGVDARLYVAIEALEQLANDNALDVGVQNFANSTLSKIREPKISPAPNTELLRDCRDALSRPTGDHDDKVRNMALLNRIDQELGGEVI